MLKKIKRTKEMRLDELIKYVWDNGMEDIVVKNKTGNKQVHYGTYGTAVFLDGFITKDDVFEMEVEETITEDTEFRVLIEIFSKTHTITHNFKSIKEIKDGGTEKIYALTNGELKLVWECDTDE